MSLFDKLPSFAFFAGVRYEAYGDKMRKQWGSKNLMWGVPKAPAQPTLADGASGNMDAGTYKVFCVGETSTGYRGMPYSNTPQEIVISENGRKISATNIPVFADPQIAFVSLWRTSKDALAPFYFAGRVPNGTTSLDLNGSDDSLPVSDVLEPPECMAEDETSYAGPFRYETPPPKGRCFSWDGRLWAFGEKKLTLGRISATTGDLYMTISGDPVPSDAVGKFIVLENEEIGYEIVQVLSPTEVKVAQAYAIPAFRSADPVSVPFYIYGNPYEVAYSETDGPDYFPWTNRLLVGQEDGGTITTGTPHLNEALFFSEASIYSVYRTGNATLPYATRKTQSPAGCPAPNSLVNAGGAVFFYDGRNFRAYANNTSERIDADLGDWPSLLREDMRAYIKGCMVGDRIYWAVPVDPSGDWLDEIWVYDVKHGFWDLPWRDLRVIDLESVINDNGVAELWLEIPAGVMSGWQFILDMHINTSTAQYALHKFDSSCLSDGYSTSSTCSGSVTSATSSTLTDTAASFPVTGTRLNGLKVEIVAGTGAGQKRWIDSTSPTTLTIDKPWTTIPDTTSRYTVGAIDWQAVSGHQNIGRPHDEKTFMHFELGFQGERDD